MGNINEDNLTPIDKFVVLVVDKNHSRYKQIGRLVAHDWREYGNYHVEFIDGKIEEFYDGIIQGDPPSSVKVFYRHNDRTGTRFDNEDKGPKGFKDMISRLKIDIKATAETYHELFGEHNILEDKVGA